MHHLHNRCKFRVSLLAFVLSLLNAFCCSSLIWSTSLLSKAPFYKYCCANIAELLWLLINLLKNKPGSPISFIFVVLSPLIVQTQTPCTYFPYKKQQQSQPFCWIFIVLLTKINNSLLDCFWKCYFAISPLDSQSVVEVLWRSPMDIQSRLEPTSPCALDFVSPLDSQ